MKPLIIANWKMNPTSVPAASALARAVARGLKTPGRAEVVIAPPYPYLAAVGRAAPGLQLGAQDVFWEPAGPYTGEVSPAMLKNLGVAYVIIGHSERRARGESEETIALKVRAAAAAGITPVVAIGEAERESQEVVPSAIRAQLSSALRLTPRRHLGRALIAYEPLWAISTRRGSRPDTPDNATRRALYIRKLLVKLIGEPMAAAVRVIYGGSVNAQNAASFLSRDIRGMEGLLVGRASLDAEEFVKIVQSVAARSHRR